MIISMIAAIDPSRAIGRDNKTPWHLPADLRWFREKTVGKPVITGRKTYESVGHPLPDRYNIIVTRNPDYTVPGCPVVHSVEDALEVARIFAQANNQDEIMILGGAQIFRLLLPQADRLYLTYIDGEFDGDTFFPAVDPDNWVEVSREFHAADEDNQWDYTFVILERPVENANNSP